MRFGHLGWPSGIGLGPGSVLLLKVSGSILSDVNLGWANLASSKKIWMRFGYLSILFIYLVHLNLYIHLCRNGCIFLENLSCMVMFPGVNLFQHTLELMI